MIRHLFLPVCMPVLFAAAMAVAQEDPGPAPTGDAEDVTIITADRLVFDNKQHFAFFQSNVVVTDPAMKLTADELRVTFDVKNKVQSIVAQGHVVIEQDDRKAWASQAIYKVGPGEIVLSGKPRVRRGQDVLTGETITFYRDDEKMICYPKAKLIIFPEEGRSTKSLLGE